MFSRVLIANRGEIAVRIARTCRRMGVGTVAVYSDADAGAAHVEACDTAVRIGGPAPSDSYLRGERIVEAALEMGAEAIHPGYGFLSENPGFVEAVEAAGLVFIGPSAPAIRAMGLKGEAKAVMEAAGVPVVPGYHGAEQDDSRLAEEAARIGYPVLVKAVAGGGGKGMRLAERAEAFAEGLSAARAEARGAFGNDDVLIEKFVPTPRHIEVQVFGDGERAIHLFERDCSLQRRHQKVLEEAPAPGMTEEMRAEMGAAAVRAAEAVGYSGAGTVEFIADASDGLRADRFYFMEMNTRLQVEHPVTEAITGIDLVEWQLRVAAGEGLPASQEALSITGHAVEARLYAEDPATGFLPQTGRLTHLAFPPGIRADSGVRSGDVVTPHYDPMIAKIVAQGADRREAFARLAAALGRTEVAGCATNLSFLRALALDEAVLAGRVDTGLIARELARLTALPEPEGWRVALGIVALAGLTDPPPGTGFTLWDPLRRTVPFLLDGEAREAALIAGPDGIDVELDGTTHRVAGRTVDGVRRDATAVSDDAGVTVFGAGALRIERLDPLDRAGAASASGDAVLAPMPGRVTQLAVEAGQAVEEGQRLAVMEAMKMEHVLRAPRGAKVAEVAAAVGDQVEAGALLVRLE